MAKTLGKEPWIFTATSDAEGQGNSGEYDFPFYIDHIDLDTGDGGDFLLLDASGGDQVKKLDNTPANDTIRMEIRGFVQGIFVSTLATNGRILVFHEPQSGTPSGRPVDF